MYAVLLAANLETVHKHVLEPDEMHAILPVRKIDTSKIIYSDMLGMIERELPA